MSAKVLRYVFCRLFDWNGDVRDIFDEFRYAESVDELKNSRALERFTNIVMNAMDQAFNNFNNETQLCEVLWTTGRFHASLWGFKSRFFWVNILRALKAQFSFFS